MSSLIFFTSETEALVATDTLVIDAETKEHIFFCSKALYLPHVNTIVAATGVAGFANQWCMFINNGIKARGVDEICKIAQPILFEAFDRYKSLNSIDNQFTVTVYHFGFSKKESRVKAYAHRSSDDFSPELLAYGLGMKPECHLPDGSHSPESLILPLMKKQAAEQEQVKEDQRVFIGGEANAVHLTSNGCMSYKVGDL